jgi:hypothetical protein
MAVKHVSGRGSDACGFNSIVTAWESGSPHRAACRTNRAAAVYELLEDSAAPEQRPMRRTLRGSPSLDRGTDPALTVEVFRRADAVQSDPEGYGA